LEAKNLQSVRKRQAKDVSVVLHCKSSLSAASHSRTDSSAESEGAGEREVGRYPIGFGIEGERKRYKYDDR
jgi:hypothetical protein